jgi:hypothetical protein
VAYPLTIARLNKGRLNACRLNWIGADVTPPTAPSNLTATAAGGHLVNLAWTASIDDYQVWSYHVERCAGVACTDWHEIGFVFSDTLAYSDATANPSTTYRYRVRTRDRVGNISPYSNIATATTADLVNISIIVGGTWTSINPYARVAGASITQALNEVPDTLTLRIDGKCPYALKGAEIQWINSENELQFAGHITAVRTTYEGRAKNRVYECDCIDYTWLLNSKKVTNRYLNQPTAGILSSLVTLFAPSGYTVDTSLLTNNLTLDEITFTNEELSQAISRTCERAGAYWLVDYAKVVRAFNSPAIPSAGTIDQTHPRQAQKLAKHEDYVPVATRIFGRGNGAPVSVDVAPGSTTLPVDDASWYNSGGGWVECGPQRIHYQGVSDPGTGSIVGAGNAPANGPTIASAAGSNLGAGLAYRYATTFVTANGETLPGPAVTYTPVGGSIAPPPAPAVEIDYYSGAKFVVGGSYRWALEFEVSGGGRVGGAPSGALTIPAGDYGLPKYVRVSWPSSIFTDPSITKVNVCRTTNGGGTFYFDLQQGSPGSSGWVTSTTLIDADLVQQGQMGGGGGALLAARLSQIPISARPGITARKIYRTAANGSQLKLLATINDNTTTTYLDSTPDGGLGANAPTLDTSGILGGGQINAGATAILVASPSPFPPSGGWVRVGERVLRYSGISGSSLTLPTPLDSTLSYGTEIVNAPHLTGIPAPGQGGAIVIAIAAGDQALLLTWVQDQNAIDALKAATGGDGIRDEFLTDGRLGLAELTARVQATLAMRKDPLVTVTLETRDPAVSVGKTITFNTTDPPIAGTFLVQRVTISDFQAKGSIAHPLARRVVECSSRRYTFDDLVQQIKLLGRIN